MMPYSKEGNGKATSKKHSKQQSEAVLVLDLEWEILKWKNTRLMPKLIKAGGLYSCSTVHHNLCSSICKRIRHIFFNIIGWHDKSEGPTA